MYVVRDEDGDLYLYMEKPIKGNRCWVPKYNDNKFFKIHCWLFPRVSWEDEEPTEVELVKKGE